MLRCFGYKLRKIKRTYDRLYIYTSDGDGEFVIGVNHVLVRRGIVLDPVIIASFYLVRFLQLVVKLEDRAFVVFLPTEFGMSVGVGC